MTAAQFPGSRSARPGSPVSFVLEPQQLAYALPPQHLHGAFHGTGFPGREDDGKLLNKAFPLADHGCAILLFLGEFRRNLFALPRRDVAFFTRAKNSVDQTRASDQANLASMQRCEWPSSDNGWFRGENSRRLPVGRRVRNEILPFIDGQALER